jgi:cell division protein FtsB
LCFSLTLRTMGLVYSAMTQAPAARRRRSRLQATPPLLGLWLLRLLVAVGLAALIGYLPYHLYLRSGLSHFMAQRAELMRLEQQNRDLRDLNTELRLQLSRIQEDDGEIERVARDELGLLRAGELVFKVE